MATALCMGTGHTIDAIPATNFMVVTSATVKMDSGEGGHPFATQVFKRSDLFCQSIKLRVACLQVCRLLSAPPYGHVSIVGNRATFTCHYGYKLYGQSQIYCVDGQWGGTSPDCRRGETPTL